MCDLWHKHWWVWVRLQSKDKNYVSDALKCLYKKWMFCYSSAYLLYEPACNPKHSSAQDDNKRGIGKGVMGVYRCVDEHAFWPPPCVRIQVSGCTTGSGPAEIWGYTRGMWSCSAPQTELSPQLFPSQDLKKTQELLFHESYGSRGGFGDSVHFFLTDVCFLKEFQRTVFCVPALSSGVTMFDVLSSGSPVKHKINAISDNLGLFLISCNFALPPV